MAPIISRTEKGNKVDAILAFAKSLEDTIHTIDSSHLPQVQLHNEIETLNLLHEFPSLNKRIDIDKQGTRLWNLAAKLTQKNFRDTELLSSVRVLAYLLIDFAGRCNLRSARNGIRVLRTSLKTVKYCLEDRQLAHAEIVIERAAYYHERLKEAPDAQIPPAKSLSIEYLIIRVALAWRQGRLDFAKLMLSKLITTSDCIDTNLAEELSDLLFEIGKDLLTKAQWVDASFWLEAAYDGLAGHSAETLSRDAEGLKVGIGHGIAKCLAHKESETARRKAWIVVEELFVQYGDKLTVLLLKLDLLAIEPTPAVEYYRDTLLKVASSFHLTDSNISILLYHTHILKAWDPAMAHAVLFKILEDRFLGDNHQPWAEKTFITIVWNCVTTKDFPAVIATLTDTFGIANNPEKALSTSATHAAQVLLWKRIDAAYKEEMYEVAESWCKLSLHEIFRSSGGINTGKLQRKLILCCLGMSNAIKARDIVATMSEANKSDASTQYLLYKVALRCQDVDMAAQSLNAICSNSAKDGTLLYACVLEAQREGNEGQIITTLQRVLDQFSHAAPAGVHLPALLRCNARLLMRSIDSLTNEAIESLCKLFEGAASQARHSRRQDGDKLFTINELDWFSRNCYNLSLKTCHSWPPHQSLRVVQAALRFIDIYPPNLEPATLADLSLRRLFCDFVLCSICVHLARSEDNVETQLQHYLLARHAVSDWRSHRRDQNLRLEGGALSDLDLKHNTLLFYDFEAAARLKSWEDLSKIIAECQIFNDTSVFATLADIVLASEAPGEIIISSLQQVINATWQVKTINIEKLSRWIRCLVSQAFGSNIRTVEKILDQAISIVENTNKTKEDGLLYPAEELEWLATTVFNRAIDFYCSSLDIECRRWAEKALVLGGLCKDGGLLHGVLQEKYQSLVWQDR